MKKIFLLPIVALVLCSFVLGDITNPQVNYPNGGEIFNIYYDKAINILWKQSESDHENIMEGDFISYDLEYNDGTGWNNIVTDYTKYDFGDLIDSTSHPTSSVDHPLYSNGSIIWYIHYTQNRTIKYRNWNGSHFESENSFTVTDTPIWMWDIAPHGAKGICSNISSGSPTDFWVYTKLNYDHYILHYKVNSLSNWTYVGMFNLSTMPGFPSADDHIPGLTCFNNKLYFSEPYRWHWAGGSTYGRNLYSCNLSGYGSITTEYSYPSGAAVQNIFLDILKTKNSDTIWRFNANKSNINILEIELFNYSSGEVITAINVSGLVDWRATPFSITKDNLFIYGAYSPRILSARNIIHLTNYSWNIEDLPSSDNYKVRVKSYDNINYSNWDESNGFFTITYCTSPILTVKAITSPNTELTIQAIHLYTDSMSYIGEETTNNNGEAFYCNLSDDGYKAKTKFQYKWFWSPVITYPNETLALINITLYDFEVSVYLDDDSLTNQDVHCYTNSISEYIGVETTDVSGKTYWNLSQGDYKCKTFYRGSEFWSNLTDPYVQGSAAINIDLTNVSVYVYVDEEPLENQAVHCYTSDNNYYLGGETTDSDGKTLWEMTSENHKCKTYYEGEWLWTDDFTVPDTTNVSIDIETEQLEVHAIARNPLTSQSVHLYTSSMTYIGEETTNEYGIAYYDVADNTYKAKTYYQGLWWWSPVIDFPIETQAIINISITDVAVYVFANNQSLENQNVHCYRNTGTYIGYDATDATGKSDWELSDGIYQCKTQYNSVWYWTNGNFTVPDTTNVSIEI